MDISNNSLKISKEEFKLKIQDHISEIKLSKGIQESIMLNSSFSNQVILIAGSLYLAGEVLNLN